MKITSTYEYTHEGTPLFLGDLTSAALWTGTQPSGEVVIHYGGLGIEKLPSSLLQNKKRGRQTKKFKSLKEAVKFEQAVIAAFKVIHPKAVPPAEHPDYSGYYVNGESVFGVEKEYNSAYTQMTKSLKSLAEVMVVDKKKKAKALFFEQEPGVLLVDRKLFTIVVVKFHTSTISVDKVITTIEKKPIPTKKGELFLEGNLFVFDSSMSACELAQRNWGHDDFTKGATQSFTKTKEGPLYILNQQIPCVAFMELPMGDYGYVYDADVPIGNSGASVLWLYPAK